jgi:glycerophosphoryl diester phosphodiesterase
MGCCYIKCDVILTKDRVPVIIHDEILDRTTNGTGNVIDTCFNDIKALDAGSWLGKEFTGEKVPSLAELID